MEPLKKKKMQNFKTTFLNESHLPLVIEPEDSSVSLSSALDLLQNQRPLFKQNLLKYGALLFRNFPIKDAPDFVSLLKSLEMGNFCNYVGGDSPRKKVVDGVYTSTEAPPSIKLPLHNELSYVKSY